MHVCKEDLKYPKLLFKSELKKNPEFSELSQVHTTIVCKHKYFPLIKNVASLYPPPRLLPVPNDALPRMYTHIHTHTVVTPCSNPVTVTYIQPNLRKVITLIVSQAADSS